MSKNFRVERMTDGGTKYFEVVIRAYAVRGKTGQTVAVISAGEWLSDNHDFLLERIEITFNTVYGSDGEEDVFYARLYGKWRLKCDHCGKYDIHFEQERNCFYCNNGTLKRASLK